MSNFEEILKGAEAQLNLCVGHFNSLHIGNISVLEKLKAMPGHSCVIMLKRKCEISTLYTCSEVLRAIKSHFGLELVLVSENSKARAFKKIIDLLNDNANKFDTVTLVYSEKDAQFIKNAAVTHEASNIVFEKLPEILYEDQQVSQQLILWLFKANRISEALKLLCNSYIVEGKVVHGNGDGRKVGMPTANIKIPHEKIYPPYGVYASIMHVKGKNHLAATNIGLRPSHDSDPTPSMESFIIDFDENIYGEDVVVELKEFLRPVLKFNNPQDGKQQGEKDVEMIKMSQ